MSVILSAALPVLLCVLLGYFIGKAGKPFNKETVTYLVGRIGTPVLIFYSLVHSTVTPATLALVGGATMISILFYLLVGMIALRIGGLKIRVYLPSLSFPNTGNLGLPLAYYAFGDEGLNYAIAIFALVAISNHTIGQTITAGRSKWRTVASNPVIPAVILGLAVYYFQIQLPVWLDNTLEILAGLTIPLMLLMLGTSLASIPVTAVARSIWLSIVRIVMGLVAGFGLSYLFGFSGAAMGAFVIQSAMPVAVYNYVYSQMYDSEPEEIASLVVVSTLISFITLPLLLSYLAA